MRLSQMLFATGAAVLAAGPIRWLAHTWSDPAFDSPGPWVLGLVVALFGWSWSSPRVGADVTAGARAHRLLGATAFVRLVSHVLDVDVLGGFALVVDVYALGLLCGLPFRRRALSPAVDFAAHDDIVLVRTVEPSLHANRVAGEEVGHRIRKDLLRLQLAPLDLDVREQRMDDEHAPRGQSRSSMQAKPRPGRLARLLGCEDCTAALPTQ